jgi:biopolymer transport protein ExbD
MKAMISLKGRTASEMADVPELDVTPVMNVFVILIPFLVSMAAFTHLSVLSFNLPPNVSTGLSSEAGKPKIKMTIVVAPSYIAITHGDHMLDSLPAENGDYAFDRLKERIASRRASMEIQDEAIIAVRDAIQFKQVVRIMDICKVVGFGKIGISNATGDAERIHETD